MSLLSQFSPGGTTKNIRTVEIFGVGGGGGGGNKKDPNGPSDGGGGGGGAVIYQRLQVETGITYNISIGSGGAAGINSTAFSGRAGGSGSNTTFGNIIMYGGGGGGGGGDNSPESFGSTGGMGRDAEMKSAPPTNLISLPTKCAFESSISVDYMYLSSPGRVQNLPPASFKAPAAVGGGGAGLFYNNSTVYALFGGDGIPAEVIGISTIVVGGGGGAKAPAPTGPTAPVNGGGGGDGSTPGGNGIVNTGGGGGGGENNVAGTGGSGVLFVRYPTAYAAATVTGNTTAPSQPGYYVYRWNSGPGSITFN